MRRFMLIGICAALLLSCDARVPADRLAAGSALSATEGLHPTGPSPLSPDEVHSVHAPWGIPSGMPATNDLIFRYSYTASTNDRTRFADWVAYAVRPDWAVDAGSPDRDYRTDPFLDESETLESRPGMGDYEGAASAHDYHRGHLVPLASFESSAFVQEVNMYSVMAPQVQRLNTGPWKSLESRARRFAVDSHAPVFVLAGPIYDPADPMPPLPGADEEHLVPTAFWMVVCEGSPGDGSVTNAPRVAAFIVPQRLPDYDGLEDFLATVDAVEAASGLELLAGIDSDEQAILERSREADWFLSH